MANVDTSMFAKPGGGSFPQPGGPTRLPNYPVPDAQTVNRVGALDVALRLAGDFLGYYAESEKKKKRRERLASFMSKSEHTPAELADFMVRDPEGYQIYAKSIETNFNIAKARKEFEMLEKKFDALEVEEEKKRDWNLLAAEAFNDDGTPDRDIIARMYAALPDQTAKFIELNDAIAKSDGQNAAHFQTALGSVSNSLVSMMQQPVGRRYVMVQEIRKALRESAKIDPRFRRVLEEFDASLMSERGSFDLSDRNLLQVARTWSAVSDLAKEPRKLADIQKEIREKEKRVIERLELNMKILESEGGPEAMGISREMIMRTQQNLFAQLSPETQIQWMGNRGFLGGQGGGGGGGAALPGDLMSRIGAGREAAETAAAEVPAGPDTTGGEGGEMPNIYAGGTPGLSGPAAAIAAGIESTINQGGGRTPNPYSAEGAEPGVTGAAAAVAEGAARTAQGAQQELGTAAQGLQRAGAGAVEGVTRAAKSIIRSLNRAKRNRGGNPKGPVPATLELEATEVPGAETPPQQTQGTRSRPGTRRPTEKPVRAEPATEETEAGQHPLDETIIPVPGGGEKAIKEMTLDDIKALQKAGEFKRLPNPLLNRLHAQTMKVAGVKANPEIWYTQMRGS